MENKDNLNEQASATAQYPDNLTTDTSDQGTLNSEMPDNEPLNDEEAINVNGGNPTEESAEPTPGTENSPTVDAKPVNEVAELKEKYLRLYADFENFRRRTAKEKLDLINNAGEATIKALLPVVDDFERAKQATAKTDDINAVREGVDIIYNRLVKTLESKGLKPMVAVGQPFDADLYESIAQFPAPSEDLKGKVIDETEKGYYLNDKVIRFAKVIVGS